MVPSGGFRKTKAYDLLIALPLIGWYVIAVWRETPLLMRQIQAVLGGQSGPLEILSLASYVGSIAFSGLLIVLLIERGAAVGRLPGIMPRLTAFIGTFLAISFLRIPVVSLPFWPQLVANLLVVVGFILMVIVVYRLGRSFSIMPEARKLVTTGPYRIVRHPLYMVEELVLIGIVMQHVQPLSVLIGLVHAVFQYRRTVYEERVLAETFPEYREYQKRTPWRFIPGVI